MKLFRIFTSFMIGLALCATCFVTDAPAQPKPDWLKYLDTDSFDVSIDATSIEYIGRGPNLKFRANIRFDLKEKLYVPGKTKPVAISFNTITAYCALRAVSIDHYASYALDGEKLEEGSSKELQFENPELLNYIQGFLTITCGKRPASKPLFST